MKWINPYLMFDGRCKEAMEFYKAALGAELQTMAYSEEQYPGSNGEKMMHARLTHGGAVLMASDSTPDKPVHGGNNVWCAIECESRDEIERAFAAMSAGGEVTMPLQDTFWGAYFGMLRDQFGFHWMFNLETTGGGA